MHHAYQFVKVERKVGVTNYLARTPTQDSDNAAIEKISQITKKKLHLFCRLTLAWKGAVLGSDICCDRWNKCSDTFVTTR